MDRRPQVPSEGRGGAQPAVGSAARSDAPQQRDCPPNRHVDLRGYIQWHMDEAHKGRSIELTTLGLVLHMSEWQRIIDRLIGPAPSEIVPPKRWLAFDVGCIECGEESAVIGTYATKEEAEAACKVASDEQEKNWNGQHSMEVFELPQSATTPNKADA